MRARAGCAPRASALIRSASSEPTRFSSRPGRLHEAKRRLEEELAVERAANASDEANRQRGGMRDGRRTSARLKPYTPPDPPADNVSITDPDSRLVRGMRRWIEGYNAQAAGNERDLILAAEAMTTSADFGHLRPMLTAARSELAAASVTEGPKVVVADADHWHLEQMNEITGQRIPVLIPPDSSQRKNTRPGWHGGAYDFVRAVLSTDRGTELNKHRARSSSSRSSATPNATAASPASPDAADQRRGPSGG